MWAAVVEEEDKCVVINFSRPLNRPILAGQGNATVGCSEATRLLAHSP